MIVIGRNKKQLILSSYYYYSYFKMPNQILVNGQNYNYTENFLILNGDINNTYYNITIIWSEPLITAYKMFYDITNIIKIDLSQFDSSQITKMEFMFGLCTSLREIDLSNFNTSSAKSMRNMFSECYKLESLNLSSFDTSQLESMVELFNNCH